MFIDLPGHPSISRTLSLTKPTMSPNPSCGDKLPSSRTRVHCDLLAYDKAIGNEFSDSLAGVGVGDFVYFVGIKPDFTLTTPNNRGSKPLLGA